MNEIQVMRLQKSLAAIGLYAGAIDGKWGDQSQTAFDSAIELATLRNACGIPRNPEPAVEPPLLAWGAHVSSVFRERVQWIANDLQLPASRGASWLMACIAWESGETFSSGIKNMAGSGAVGLIQFMPSTARSLGTSSAELAQMTPEDQLNYVYRYFREWRGRLKNLGDVYMAILWPAGVGKDDTYVLWNKDAKPTTYRQNAGLDGDKNGDITRAEALAKIQAKYNKGMLPGNAHLGG